ncbi:aminoglycoside phosphotransferase family protein [Aetokthonos hydrillicola Thurmond2011]|jgi:aminoglycoside phosphotransferase (APT) family kinase protein|uniref:Aminoglycoside phosphotransferase family protein n=1 Tax=Aetokthonos hydrillicola Thurmond2011 TaxID=2712845 RepID=A0AAP5IDW9_9CYAN|nr:aminoglycoside phosphotransferase family protein [Aetokthonos hydrillicola]MBO3460727.1 aminoglycoside phosphotransferase family protein [Aetokthonos hydrillicola CCALA 1050]MBW4586416.1 aminoglycoside phosphotransferase family protein [Aetokthonos hydrillicola CCALA 1050]MDR9899875.1 aminoglycoside phosphotransferase family protein [Aetokthonos hydrillicola Thurmond2011]
MGTPISEVEINISLVRSLLEEQCPDLAHLPISMVDAGWDNAIFRLGDRLCIRLPRRQVGAVLIEHEQTWLPRIASHLTLAVPTPCRIGKPGQRYPWKWSILPWLAGVSADQQEPDEEQAKSFALFLRSLHIPAPPDAPKNPVRGVPLYQRATTIEERMQRLEVKTNLITREIKNIWNQALQTPIDVFPTWLHGDLHPRNILVENGSITGIIDWGDITSGDIATDLASIWMLFPSRTAREQVIAEYGNISQATLQRALGWAIVFGVLLLDTGLVDNPRHALMGKKIFPRLALHG